MKAVFFKEHGDSSKLEYGDLPEPQLQDGYALVKVRAVALNHLDIWVRRGWPGLKLNLPHIGGSDIAGELVAIKGTSVDQTFTPNSRVVVNPGVNTIVDEWTRRGEDSLSPSYKIIGEQLPGGMADYIVVPIANLIKIPDHISFEEAAAPILVGMTSWRMLFKRGLLQTGETVLVVGSGGGVNSMSILLAKAAGATVIALAGGEEKAKRAAKLGADYVINYKSLQNWHLEVLKITSGRGVDLVIDNVGKATFEGSIRSVRRGGKIVTVGNTSGYEIVFDNRLLFTKQISLIGSTMGSSQDLFDFLNFFWTRKMKPVIDRVAPLKDGPQMLKLLEIGEQFGKIVLSV
ncbi:MAG TPA: zinc-binding dehydrogenase [Oligoflexia bacterium]|nr:zinc-binding dehydrogenase [Oligoflexia bacterium]HMP27918.1 zinc-binding dehydrogenase [Oligoflexia bacterium]